MTQATAGGSGLMHEIMARLERIELQSRLGLGLPPVTRTIYCNRGHGGLWYIWNGLEKQAEPVTAPAVTGYARKLEVVEGEYKGKTTYSLQLTLDCGHQWYVLCAGHDSTFSKGLFLAIALLSPEQLRRPISVSPRPGDEEKVLLCSVWAGKDYIKTEWPEDPATFRQALAKACGKVANANQ